MLELYKEWSIHGQIWILGDSEFIKDYRGKISFGAKYYKAPSFCMEIEDSYENMSSYMAVVNWSCGSNKKLS